MASRDAGVDRIRAEGKFFRAGTTKWTARGFSYGPFRPRGDGDSLPERGRLLADFDHMRDVGANLVRLYTTPSPRLLDDALARGLRVLVDVPWERHRCVLEDGRAWADAIRQVDRTARDLGSHPGLFAISVGNEIPADVVRFSGRDRVERLVRELIDVVRQRAPDCLTTYVNYPTTEFLGAAGGDFCCFNVYLHDAEKFGRYLDRLQHIAGDVPLVLGEYGVDSSREGEDEQADLLEMHVTESARRGVAGSIVFSYTDDWFRGGRQVDDWAFGITRTDRSEKPAAARLRAAWRDAGEPRDTLPFASVVVCSYNGSRTLAECLDSLTRLRYPRYEVLLVDDGSTDDLASIAARFPRVRYIPIPHAGLSTARNVGMRAASGEFVAYIDDDAAADEDWLAQLVATMVDRGIDGAGGPNLPPPTARWIAQCVAASPGNPSHVMLDDRDAEHVPGCNMAFRRSALLEDGGFDARFHAAGDDVDLCWRLLDRGSQIGFAPGAVVFHHRRGTIRAFLRQQRGYGRAEAMVLRKHPDRFAGTGRIAWRGFLYGDGALGLLPGSDVVHHGRYGSAPFQILYRSHAGRWSCATRIEWHAAALLLAVAGLAHWTGPAIAAAMWIVTLVVSVRTALRAPLPRRAPWYARPVVWWLHVAQPAVRGWARHAATYSGRSSPDRSAAHEVPALHSRLVSPLRRDLFWTSDRGKGRADLLTALEGLAAEDGWTGVWSSTRTEWDVLLLVSPWLDIAVRTATEELGSDRRFTRVRLAAMPTPPAAFVALAAGLGFAAAFASTNAELSIAFAVAAGLALSALAVAISARMRVTCRLLRRAGRRAELADALPDGAPVRAGRRASAGAGEAPARPTLVASGAARASR